VDIAAVADVARAVQAVAGGGRRERWWTGEDRAAVPVDLAAANGNFFSQEKKFASFCVEKMDLIDYKPRRHSFPVRFRNAARFFPVA